MERMPLGNAKASAVLDDVVVPPGIAADIAELLRDAEEAEAADAGTGYAPGHAAVKAKKMRQRRTKSPNIAAKQLDFYSIMPELGGRKGRKSHKSIELDGSIEDVVKDCVSPRQLTQRVLLRAISEYGITNPGVISEIVAQQLESNYDVKIPKGDVLRYAEGAQLSLDYFLAQRSYMKVA